MYSKSQSVSGRDNQGNSEREASKSHVLQLEKRVEEVARQANTAQIQVCEMELQLQASLDSTYNGGFLWRLPEIRCDAVEERVMSLYSPPFYCKETLKRQNKYPRFVFTGMKAAPKCATAGEALRKCRSLLHEGILDPEGLASSLYSENIICRETLDRVLLDNTRRKKNLILLDAIEARLRTNSSDFNKFHAILDNDPHLRMFADALLGCYTTMPSKQTLHCEETEHSKSGFFSDMRKGIRKVFGAARDTALSVVKKALSVFNLDVKIDRKYKKRFDKYTNREQTRWWFEVWGDESALKALESKWEEVSAQHKWRLETCPTVPQRC